MAVNSNKAKTKGQKNESLAEIEAEETTPEVSEVPTFKLEDLTNKSPDEITAEEQDFLADNADDLTDEQKVAYGLMDAEDLGDKEEEIEEPEKKPEVEEPEKVEEPEESEEDKDKKYKAQQSETEIQTEKSKSLIEKVDQAASLTDPTPDELKAFVAQDGVTWDELTTFEQAQAKRSYLAEKRFQLVNDAVQETKKVDEWGKKVNDFIDSTDGKAEYVDLSGNEADFRKFSMKEAHRGTPLDVLLPAFLHQLVAKPGNKGSLFLKGGGGEREVVKTGMTDADQAAKIRIADPREYRRLVKAGKIKVEV